MGREKGSMHSTGLRLLERRRGGRLEREKNCWRDDARLPAVAYTHTQTQAEHFAAGLTGSAPIAAGARGSDVKVARLRKRCLDY